MSVLFGATCIIGIVFMLVFMFIGIWLFIVALKAYNQLRYKNYILEKINQSLNNLCEKNNMPTEDFNFYDYTNNEDNEETVTSFDNIKNIK